LVFNGVDTAAFRPTQDRTEVRTELKLPLDAIVLGHAARFTPWKGQDRLLKAFAEGPAADPRAYLLLVGSAMLRKERSYEHLLRETARELRIEDRVTFAGFRDDLGRVLGAMDVLAYPSTEKDTTPLALLSAMACGLPVVAFDIDGVAEVLQNGACGVLVKPNDLSGFATALTRLASSEALRRQFGAAARRRVLAEFTLDRHCSQMEAAFSAAL
jgi:glycosyltransferase involved in cell wall biosynthesis